MSAPRGLAEDIAFLDQDNAGMAASDSVGFLARKTPNTFLDVIEPRQESIVGDGLRANCFQRFVCDPESQLLPVALGNELRVTVNLKRLFSGKSYLAWHTILLFQLGGCFASAAVGVNIR